MESVLAFGTCEERVARFSRTPCPATRLSSPPRLAVLAPLYQPLDAAFERARALLEGGATAVRVIGLCAAIERSWPAWTRTVPGLVTTDIGAYRARSRTASTRAIAADVQRWLYDLLGDFGGVARGSRAFYSDACIRLFEDILLAQPFVDGLAEGLTGCEVHATGEWAGRARLHELLTQRGGRCMGAPEPRSAGRARIVASLAAHATAYTAGALSEIVRQHIRSASSRRAIARQERSTRAAPSVWVMLVPTWWRLNRHVVQSFVMPEASRGDFGTLFFIDLAPGVRSERDLRKLEGDALFAGLGVGRDAVLSSPMDQVVGPDSLGALVRTLAVSGARAMRATARLAASPPVLQLGGFSAPLGRRLPEAAKLASLLVARATATELATRAAAEKHPMRDARVLMATSGFVETAMADVVLQSLGATTIHFGHGTKSDGWPLGVECTSTCQFVWTNSDREAVRPTGQACIVAGMPRPELRPRTGPRASKRVLIMTAYLHRDNTVLGGFFPFLPSLHVLLGLVDHFAGEPSRGVTFRWRPHPAENAEAVASARDEHAPMELSTGTKLEDDLAWADVVITPHSSALFEALFADVPVFLYAQPEEWGTVATDFIEARRVFYWGEDGAAALDACFSRLDQGDVDELLPERRARKALFGETGEPRSVRTAIDDLAGLSGLPRFVA